jgi:hypothetical protein
MNGKAVPRIENMNWPKVRYALWILGFLYLGLSAVSFVSDVSQDAKNKSDAEQWVIGISDVVGVSLVLAYWGWKWYQSRDYIQGTLPFPTKKVALYVGGFIALFVFVFGLIKTVNYVVESAPEFVESQNAIKSNPAVTLRFGIIKEMESDNSGDSFEASGNTRSGTYEFQVTGTLKDGVLRIKWHEENDRFVPIEIDEIILPDTVTPLWTKS